MTNIFDSERRQAERIMLLNITDFSIYISPTESFTRSLYGRVLNVSESGMRIEVPFSMMNPGETQYFRFLKNGIEILRGMFVVANVDNTTISRPSCGISLVFSTLSNPKQFINHLN